MKNKDDYDMIIDDLPIVNIENDILQRRVFIEQVVSLIGNYADNNNSSLVIGIEGDWGEGKTSVINVLKGRLQEEGKIKGVGQINSWLGLDEQSLLTEFINEIISVIRKSRNYTEGKKYDKELLADGTEYLRKLLQYSRPSVSFGLFDCNMRFNPNWEVMFNISLREQKEKIQERMQQYLGDKKIVIFVDDIDRLNDEDILLTMQLVKNIADFPQVIYVLAYDRTVVENALDNKNRGTGSHFLDKIVQVPIRLPYIGRDVLQDYVFNALKAIFAQQDDTIDYKHIKQVYNEGISEFIKNIRHCKRLINTFYVKWLIASKFCDAGDMLGIVALEVFEPSTYRYILGHKYKFYTSVIENVVNKEKANSDETLNEIVKDVNEENINAVKHIISSLFPRFGNSVNILNNELLIKRICKEENFYYYMTLAIADDDILYDEIKKIFYVNDEKTFTSSLSKWYHENKIVNVWKKLIVVIDNASYKDVRQRSDMLFHGLSAIGGFFRLLLDCSAFDVCRSILCVLYGVKNDFGSIKIHFSEEKCQTVDK